jgi:3'(2'), 5'-bisphosphate nucleotidase
MVTGMDAAPLRYGKRDQGHDADFANPHFVAWGGVVPVAG